jgi:hypothetical protein
MRSEIGMMLVLASLSAALADQPAGAAETARGYVPAEPMRMYCFSG